jgi:foldase protein PrsA
VKKLLVLAVISAMTVAACGGPGRTAATVNGTDITVGEVDNLRFQAPSTPVNKPMFASDLDFLIRLQALADAAQDTYGISATDGEIATEVEVIVEANLQEGQTREQLLEVADRSEAYLTALAHLIVLQQKILEVYSADVDEPSEGDIELVMRELMAPFTEVCAAHILVEEEDLARELLERAQAGEDFAELAEEYGTDDTSTQGGDLGCSRASRYVVEFRDATMVAPVGELYDELVETQWGWHLILVRERTVADDEELPTREDARELLIERQALGVFLPWFTDILRQADVTVEARFGTWVTAPNPQVVPPAE